VRLNLKRRVRKIKIIVFDIDGVIFDVSEYTEGGKKVAVSTWNALFDKAGIYDEHERLKQMYIDGKFKSYMKWTDEACRVFKKHGLTKKKFMEMINERHLIKGAKETLQVLRKKDYKTATITGGFDALAKKAQMLLGIDYTVSHCKLIFDKKGKLTRWKLIPCDYEDTINYFHKILKKHNLTPEESVYIGDDVNDIPIFKESCLSIAFNCNKQEVKDAADVVINKKDLREILKYLT
jgi:phosphoserine phosphatase